MTRTLISAGALALALSLAGPVAAQSLTIGGTVVPMDELDAVQAKCDELFAENSAVALAHPDAKAPAAEAPAAGANASAAATESAAEAPVDPAATAEAELTEGNMAAETEVDVEVTIDLASLTVELCEEGGFTASID